MLTYAITDIHGRLDLLDLALEEIEKRGGEYKIVFLGDYVDRGPNSRGVVDRLIELSRLENVVCLYGNHEDIFVGLCTNPERYQSVFFNNGGSSTLEGYMLDGDPDLDAMTAHCEWMQSLPRHYFDEKRVFVHAGIEPGMAMDKQDPEELIWTRSREFFNASRLDMGYYVVHGHTPEHPEKYHDNPEVTESRTNLDTAAFFTGILSVGVFDETQEGPIEIIKIEVKGEQNDRDDRA